MSEDDKVKLLVGALALVGLGFLFGGSEGASAVTIIVVAAIALCVVLLAIDRIIRFCRKLGEGKDKGQ